jgi:hypothetical protein
VKRLFKAECIRFAGADPGADKDLGNGGRPANGRVKRKVIRSLEVGLDYRAAASTRCAVPIPEPDHVWSGTELGPVT